MYDFSEVVDNSFITQESVVITNYLYDVSQKLSRYYNNISILSEEDKLVRDSRLVLLNATKTVLSNGMKILGINPVKKL